MQDTILYSVAQFGSRILLFVMLPFYTHYFSPDEFGMWDLIITTIAFMTPFISMEMIAAVYRWLLDAKDDANRQQVISTGTWIITRNLLLFNGLAVVVLLLFSIPYGWLSLIVINTDVISSFVQQITRGLQRNILFASLGIVHAITFVAFILILIFVMHMRIEAFFYATIAANILVTAVAIIRANIHTYVGFHFLKRSLIKPMLMYALPIIPGALSWWVISLSDRYFITFYLGVHANGIFAVAAKIPAIIMLLNSVFALAWKDSAIRTFNDEEKNEYYTNVFSLFFKGLSASVICILLSSKLLITWFIGETYVDAWKYGNILMVGALFHACALFWAAGFHGAKKTNAIFSSAVIGAILSVLGNLIFIPFFGLYAVAITSAISFLGVWLIRIKQAKSVFRIQMDSKIIVFFAVAGGIAMALPYIVSDTMQIVSTILAVVLFMVLWWKDILWVLMRYMRKGD